MKCTDAWNISIKYDRTTANTLASKSYISEHDRRLRTLKLVMSIELSTSTNLLEGSQCLEKPRTRIY